VLPRGQHNAIRLGGISSATSSKPKYDPLDTSKAPSEEWGRGWDASWYTYTYTPIGKFGIYFDIITEFALGYSLPFWMERKQGIDLMSFAPQMSMNIGA